MSLTQINDLAFSFIESRIVLTAGTIRSFFFENGGKEEDIDYFLVFIKHWLDNKRSLEWSDVIMENTYIQNKKRLSENRDFRL